MRVAEEGGEPGDGQQQHHVDLALAGDDAAEDHRELARRDQPDERARLEERERGDQQRRSSCRAPARGPRSPSRCRGSRTGRRSRRSRSRRPRRPRATISRLPGHAISARIAPSIVRRLARPEHAEDGRPGPGHARGQRARLAQRLHPRGQLRPQRHGGRLEVVLERRGQLAERPGRELAHAVGVELRARRAEQRPPARRRRPSTGRPRPAPAAASSAAAPTGSTPSPAPVTSACRGSTWLGTSAPRPAPSARRPSASSGSPGQPVRRAQDRRRVGAAAAQPGGDGDPLVDRHAERRKVGGRLGPEALDGGEREVRALDARAAHLVRIGRLDRQLVRQVDRREQGAELVQPVGAPRADVQQEVDLRRRPLADHAPSISASRRKSSGDSRSARASGGWPISTQCRLRSLAVEAGEGERARAAPCAGARTRRARARTTARSGDGGAAR